MSHIAEPADDERYISTGALPTWDAVRNLVDDAHRRWSVLADGSCSTVYPALARADPAQFGICIAAVNGNVHGAGHADVGFPIMSVSKPFTFALVCDAIGAEEVRRAIGVDATGLPFDSLEAVERFGGRTNPMVNAGAIATVGLVPGAGADERWHFVHEGLSRFAGRELQVDEDVLASAAATNLRNRAIAQLLESLSSLHGDPWDALDRYTRQSCLAVTARDLALMGATLADGGVHPISGERVISETACRCTLSVMATAGLYEHSGDWLYEVGLPAKSGIGGGIVTVSPGKGGLGTFSPPLDDAGNSVRGRRVAADLSARLGLDIFASRPPT